MLGDSMSPNGDTNTVGAGEVDVPRRCKHCGEIVMGGRDARREHKQKHCAALRDPDAENSAVAGGRQSKNKVVVVATGGNVPSSSKTSFEAEVKNMTRREQWELVSRHTCTYCGGLHSSQKCEGKLPVSYQQRMRLQRKKAAQLAEGDTVPVAHRNDLTPDLGRFDASIQRLVEKVVPKASSIPSPLMWRHCDYCGKRLVASMVPLHVAQGCIVQTVTEKVLTIETLLKLCPPSQTTTSDAASAPQQRPLSPSTSLVAAAAALQHIPISARGFEQLRGLLASVHAVVPIDDLLLVSMDELGEPLPHDERKESARKSSKAQKTTSALSAHHYAQSFRTIASHVLQRLPEISERVRQWADATKSAALDRSAHDITTGRRQRAATPPSLRHVLHSPGLDLLVQRSATAMAVCNHNHATEDDDDEEDNSHKRPFSKATMDVAKKLNSGAILSLQDELDKQQRRGERHHRDIRRRQSSRSRSTSPTQTNISGENAPQADSDPISAGPALD